MFLLQCYVTFSTVRNKINLRVRKLTIGAAAMSMTQQVVALPPVRSEATPARIPPAHKEVEALVKVIKTN